MTTAEKIRPDNTSDPVEIWTPGYKHEHPLRRGATAVGLIILSATALAPAAFGRTTTRDKGSLNGVNKTGLLAERSHTTEDQLPNLLSGTNQIHLVDAIPSDRQDLAGDLNGDICKRALGFANFLGSQIPGMAPRFDLLSGVSLDAPYCDQLDITRLVLQKSEAQLADSGSGLGNEIYNALKDTKGYSSLEYYMVFYEGRDNGNDCAVYSQSSALNITKIPGVPNIGTEIIHKQNCDIGHVDYNGWSFPEIGEIQAFLIDKGYHYSPVENSWMYQNTGGSWQWWKATPSSEIISNLSVDPYITWPLKVLVKGKGTFNTSPASDPGMRFPGGTNVKILPKPAPGYHLDLRTNTEASQGVMMDKAESITLNFAPNSFAKINLTVHEVGKHSLHLVSVSGQFEGNGIRYPGDPMGTAPQGAKETLVAHKKNSKVELKWAGCTHQVVSKLIEKCTFYAPKNVALEATQK